MRTAKKKIQCLILTGFFGCLIGCLPQDVSNYHLDRTDFPSRVSTHVERFRELRNSYPDSHVSVELCFETTEGGEWCGIPCFANRETGEVSCDLRNPFWRLENDQDFRLHFIKDDRSISYSPTMTIQQLIAQQATPLVVASADGGSGAVAIVNHDCADGETWSDETGGCELVASGGGDGGGGGGGGADPIDCAVACGTGEHCDTTNGMCVANPDTSLCAGVICGGADQACNTETGLCEDLSSGSGGGSGGDGGSGGTGGTENRLAENNDPAENPLMCAYNPSQCANTKGWCSLNANATFDWMTFGWMLLPGFLLILRRTTMSRTVLQSSHD